MWRSWTDHPPQIPHGAIEVSLCADGIRFITTAWEMRGSKWREMARWKPLGTYREEFWAVTNRWE